MGARVGGELVAAGHEVRWLPAGRSAATEKRADVERLTPVADAAALVDGADLVLSLLPPQAALDVATLVSATGFSGTYVDANPLSPATLGRSGPSSKPAAPRWSTPGWWARPLDRTTRPTSTWPVTPTGWPRWRRCSPAPA